MAHEIFQWLPLIFNDFSRQNSIFPGEHKIQWLFKSRVKFHDFSRPVRTMLPIPLSHIGSKSKEDKVKVTNLKNSPKFQIYEFWNKHYTRHTFWSCLIRCANMKWIQWVFLKIQSGHDSVHRRTDRQGETSIPPFQLRWSGGIMILQRIFLVVVQ